MVRRTKEEAQVTRRTLIRAALAIFSAKGYAATTLEDIAEEAGVTRGAIYWHFGSKAELYNALMGEVSSRSGEITQAAVQEGGSLADILRRVFVRLLQAVETDKDLRAAMEIALFKTEVVPELTAGHRERRQASQALISSISQAMRAGIASGELRSDLSPEDMARGFMALQNGAMYLWLLQPQSFSLAKAAEALAEVFLRGVAAR